MWTSFLFLSECFRVTYASLLPSDKDADGLTSFHLHFRLGFNLHDHAIQPIVLFITLFRYKWTTLITSILFYPTSGWSPWTNLITFFKVFQKQPHEIITFNSKKDFYWVFLPHVQCIMVNLTPGHYFCETSFFLWWLKSEMLPIPFLVTLVYIPDKIDRLVFPLQWESQLDLIFNFFS